MFTSVLSHACHHLCISRSTSPCSSHITVFSLSHLSITCLSIIAVLTAGAAAFHCLWKFVNLFFPLCRLSLHFSILLLFIYFTFVVKKHFNFMWHHLLVRGLHKHRFSTWTCCCVAIGHSGSGHWQSSKMKNISPSGLVFLEAPPWSLMPPETMLISVVHAAALACDEAQDPCGPAVFATDRGLGDILRLWCLKGTCRFECPVAWGHVEAHGLCCHWMPLVGWWSRYSWGNLDVCGSFYHPRPCRYPQSMPLHEALLILEDSASGLGPCWMRGPWSGLGLCLYPQGCADIFGLCCHREPCLSHWT